MSSVDISPVASAQKGNLAVVDSAQLSTQLLRLQMGISKLICEGRVDAELQDKKISYNQVMDALRERQLGTRVDPMDRLPNEIINNILAEVTGHSPYPLLPLTMVSMKWRSFILSESGLWNYIRLHNEYDAVSIVSLQAYLSRNLPLTIDAQLPVDCWESIRPTLSENQDRVNRIFFRSNSYHPVELYHCQGGLQKFLGDIGILPNLQYLHFLCTFHSKGSYNVQELLDRYPSLKDLWCSSLTCQDLQAVKGRVNVTTIQTYENIQSVFPIIEAMDDLKSVTFYPSLSPSEPGEMEIIPAQELDWTQLTCREKQSSFPLSILCHLPSLIRLHVAVSTKTLGSITTVLHQFTKLDYVVMSITIRKSDVISFTPDL